jgi:hypothetical protein
MAMTKKILFTMIPLSIGLYIGLNDDGFQLKGLLLAIGIGGIVGGLLGVLGDKLLKKN